MKLFGWAFAFSGYVLYLNRAFYHDDAYITLRYVRNFVSGNGIVWNPGEYVQGYTSFLHVALLSLCGFVGADLYWASRAVGVLALLALAVALYGFRTWITPGAREDPLALLPILFSVCAGPMLVWSIGGLEVVLFCLLTSLGCLACLATLDHPLNRWLPLLSGACLALGFLTRPDGALFIAISFVWLMATHKEKRLERGLTFLLPCLVIIGPYVLWQAFYYGDVVPNTFYAKATSFSWQSVFTGLVYVARYAAQPPFLPIAVAATCVWALAKRRWNARLTYLAAIAAGYLGYVVYVGGDHMPAFRMALPAIVPMSYLLFAALKAASAPRNRLTTAGILILALVLLTGQLFSPSLNPRQEDNAAHLGTIVGKYIAKVWPSDSLVALNTAGSTPYYAPQHRYIDMLGLNNRQIARRRITTVELPWQSKPGHLKGDGAYVLSRAPDFIIVGPAAGTVISDPWFLSDLEMSRDPRFAADYRLERVVLDEDGREIAGEGLVFTYYRRVDGEVGLFRPLR